MQQKHPKNEGNIMLTKMAEWELLKINVTYIKSIQTLINFPELTFSEFWKLKKCFQQSGDHLFNKKDWISVKLVKIVDF